MRFYRFGFRERPLGEVRKRVETLGVSLHERSSDFLGGIYYFWEAEGERSTKVYSNRDSIRGAFLRPSLSNYEVLVDVVDSLAPLAVRSRFEGVGGILLDEEELPDNGDDDESEEEEGA